MNTDPRRFGSSTHLPTEASDERARSRKPLFVEIAHAGASDAPIDDTEILSDHWFEQVIQHLDRAADTLASARRSA